jgi:hypothetical protein
MVEAPGEEKKIIRRAPAIQLPISKLQENIGRVALLGTVVSKNPELSSFALDDGKSSILVLANDPQQFELVKEGQTVRVLGKVWGSGNELEIQAEIVQDFSKINRELYNKVFG